MEQGMKHGSPEPTPEFEQRKNYHQNRHNPMKDAGKNEETKVAAHGNPFIYPF